MTKYEEIISNLKHIDTAKAESLEEEINIIVHKLKFLPKDNFPKTIILDQRNNFQPYTSTILEEKVNIAGGRFIDSMNENPDCILIVQHAENLYSDLPLLLTNEDLAISSAIKNNNIYIIQDPEFNNQEENYLKDLEVLAEILQPKYFIYGHDGSTWVKFDIQ